MEHPEDCVVPIEDIAAVVKFKAPAVPRPTYNPRDHQCRGPYLSSSSSSSTRSTQSSTSTQSGQSSRTSVSSQASSRTLVHTLSNTSTFSHSSDTTLNRSLSIVTNSSLSTQSTQSTSRQWPGSTERLVQDQQTEAKADDDAKSSANEKFTKFKEAFGNFFMVVAFLLGALLIFMAIVISSNPEMFKSLRGNPKAQE